MHISCALGSRESTWKLNLRALRILIGYLSLSLSRTEGARISFSLALCHPIGNSWALLLGSMCLTILYLYTYPGKSWQLSKANYRLTNLFWKRARERGEKNKAQRWFYLSLPSVSWIIDPELALDILIYCLVHFLHAVIYRLILSENIWQDQSQGWLLVF